MADIVIQMKSGGFIVLLFVASQMALAAGERTPLRSLTNSAPAIELRGKVVCLSEEMQRLYGAPVLDKHQHDYGFKADNGFYYSFLRTPLSEGVLTDTNLQSKTLLIKARVFPKTQILEITGNLHSVRNGKLNELYYYCDVCSIKSSSPGPCMCCREPVHLVEEPVK